MPLIRLCEVDRVQTIWESPNSHPHRIPAEAAEDKDGNGLKNCRRICRITGSAAGERFDLTGPKKEALAEAALAFTPNKMQMSLRDLTRVRTLLGLSTAREPTQEDTASRWVLADTVTDQEEALYYNAEYVKNSLIKMAASGLTCSSESLNAAGSPIRSATLKLPSGC